MAHHMTLESEYRGKLVFTVKQGEILPSKKTDKIIHIELEDKIIAAGIYVHVRLRDGDRKDVDLYERAVGCLENAGLSKKFAGRFISDALDYDANPENRLFPFGKEISCDILVLPHPYTEEPKAICEGFTIGDIDARVGAIRGKIA